MKTVVVLVVLALAGPVMAQTSANFTLEEHSFSAGGHPADGATMASANFLISFDTLGEALVHGGAVSSSFVVDASFCATYPPPGEVKNLLFTDDTTLVWDPERSGGIYNLYLQTISSLSGLGYGDCEESDIVGETAIHSDLPPAADGYCYLVTAENRLAEEGSKGLDSGNAERPNPDSCP